MSRRRKVDVAKILELRSKGWSIKDIAEKLGVSRQTVYSWLRKLEKPEVLLEADKEPFVKAHVVLRTGGLTAKEALELRRLLDEIVKRVKAVKCEVWWFPVLSHEE